MKHETGDPLIAGTQCSRAPAGGGRTKHTDVGKKSTIDMRDLHM